MEARGSDRGGWKMARERSMGLGLTASGEKVKPPLRVNAGAKPGITPGSGRRCAMEGFAETGVAGFPEQNAPVQGAFRGLGASLEASAAVRSTLSASSRAVASA